MKIGIVGGGIFGVAAALELRSRGHAVTLLEEGGVPSENASSNDVSKSIQRTSYSGDLCGTGGAVGIAVECLVEAV